MSSMMIVVSVILVVMVHFSSSLESKGHDHGSNDPCNILSDPEIDANGCEIFCPCKEDEETWEWTDEFGCIKKSCIPKIEGYETICPMKCNDGWSYCPNYGNNYCEVLGHCSNYEDSTCQGGWHDGTIDKDYSYNFE